MRDSMKRPAQLAGSNVLGANVAGRRGESLGVAAAEYHQVLVNDAWAGQNHRLRVDRFPAQIFTEVGAAAVSKEGNRLAGGGIQGVDEIHYPNENALVFASGPVSETAIRLRSAYSGVEFPQELARRGIQGENFLRWGDSVEYALDDDGAGLKTAFFLGIKTPGHDETLHVGPIDLRKPGVVIVLGRAAVRRRAREQSLLQEIGRAHV